MAALIFREQLEELKELSPRIAKPAADSGRRRFLRRGAMLAGAMGFLAARPSKAVAAEIGARGQINLIRKHENAHVAFLVQTLGNQARPKPTFRNLLSSSIPEFLSMTQTFENTGTGAYLGAAPAIFSPANLAAAASIALIEGRHSGFINSLLGDSLTQNVFGQEQDFERALTIAEVNNLVSPFIANLNGGPPLTFNPNPDAASPANDIRILNFALALEYLEAEFYNLNLSRGY